MDFRIDISKIKIAGTETDISKTIEELLELNKLIPARWGEEELSITEKQFDNTKHSTDKKNRGEVEEITERQIQKNRKVPKEELQLIETRATETEESKGGHNESAWKKDEEEVKGHKNVPPIWIEVNRLEKERKDNGELKKTKKK